MAKQLSLNNIQTGQAIEAAHVSQSVNALTGTEAYDITISGSLEIIGPLTASDDIKINPSQSPNGTSVLTVDNDGRIFKTGSYSSGSSGGGTGTGFPFSGSAEITGSLLISQSGLIVTGSTQIYGSGSTIFEVQGSRGVLFSIDDDESDNKLFSVNNVTGVPVLEVYQDNTVKLGKNNGYGIIITGSGASASDLDANIILTGSIYQTGSNVIFSSNITSSGNVEINKGILSIKNNGNQSVARFYCEDNNQHYTELKAQPHVLYSGNPITLLPAYDFDFAAPNFQANITASGNISASGYISASNLNLSESITATNIYATNLVVTNITSSFITSSTIVTSGSNTFGDELSDIQTLIGSTIITGSISVSGSVINNLTSSNAISSSYSLTASYVENAQSASYVLNAISASFASTASYVLNAVSASFANTALTANSSSQATSASYALTASHALDSDPFPYTGSANITGSLGLVGPAVITGSVIISGSDSYNLRVIGNSHTDGNSTIVGNVGIGTSAGDDGGKLNVRGTSIFSADSFGRIEIIPTAGNGDTGVIKQTTDSPRNSGNLQIQVDRRNEGGYLYFATNGDNKRMTINPSGNVGIGTTDPQQKLHVQGNITASGYISASSFVNNIPGTINDLTSSYAITASHALNVATPTLQIVTNAGASTTVAITGSNISASGYISASNLILGTGSFTSPSIGFNTSNAGIFYNPNANTVAITDGTTTRAEISNYILFRTYLSMNNNYIQNISYLSGSALELRSKNPITASATISSSGNLFADVTDNSDTSFKTVMYDPTTGQFFRTGSYAPAPSSVATSSFALTASYIEASNINQPFTDITASGNISASGTGSFPLLSITDGAGIGFGNVGQIWGNEDSDIFLQTDAAGEIAFVKDNNVVFSINSNNTAVLANDFSLNVTSGSITASSGISASGDLYARDGRFTRGTAEVEIIGSTSEGIIGTETNHNLLLRRNNIEKLRFEETRTYSSVGISVTGSIIVSGSNYILAENVGKSTTTLVEFGNGSSTHSNEDTDIVLKTTGDGEVVVDIGGNDVIKFLQDDIAIGKPFRGLTIASGSWGDGNLSVTGSITVSGSVINELTASHAMNIQPENNFTPIVEHSTNFTSTSSYAGHYNIVGGDLSITVTTGSENLTPGTEWQFFQSSSIGSFTFTPDTGVSVISRNNNKRLSQLGSTGILKYISGQTFHLVGDLTI